VSLRLSRRVFFSFTNSFSCFQDQAFDRSHRVGQTRPVNIFKLKIDNTVEDRILEVSRRLTLLPP
jgi:hypothetical protein